MRLTELAEIRGSLGLIDMSWLSCRQVRSLSISPPISMTCLTLTLSQPTPDLNPTPTTPVLLR
jgi:hypothetical protein